MEQKAGSLFEALRHLTLLFALDGTRRSPAGRPHLIALLAMESAETDQAFSVSRSR